MLPCRIIRCYRSMYLFTPAMVENERKLKDLHPDWEHLFFNHYEARDWVAENMPEWLELYNFYSVDRQREQVFRWLVLWKLGGFWLSTQYHPLRSLEPLRQRPLVLAEAWRLNFGEFEKMHRMPIPPGCPSAGLIFLTDGGFAAESGNWFVGKILELLISRAGYLDSEEPSPEEEDYTTGAGILNAVWLQSLADGRISEESVLPAPRFPSAARPQAKEPDRAERPCGFGEYAWRQTDLNP